MLVKVLVKLMMMTMMKTITKAYRTKVMFLCCNLCCSGHTNSSAFCKTLEVLINYSHQTLLSLKVGFSI